MLCVGALAVGCLCGCGGEAAGSDGGSEVQNQDVKTSDKKGIPAPDFTGVTDGIQWEIYVNKSEPTEPGAVAILFTNTEDEGTAFETEISFYGEDGQVVETIEFHDGLLESNVTYATSTSLDTADPISKVEVSFLKNLPSGTTYGEEYVDITCELDGNVIRGNVKNISEDMEIFYPYMCMLLFKDGEFVGCTYESIRPGEEKAKKMIAGAEYSFEKELDVEADTMKYYWVSDTASKMVE